MGEQNEIKSVLFNTNINMVWYERVQLILLYSCISWQISKEIKQTKYQNRNTLIFNDFRLFMKIARRHPKACTLFSSHIKKQQQQTDWMWYV